MPWAWPNYNSINRCQLQFIPDNVETSSNQGADLLDSALARGATCTSCGRSDVLRDIYEERYTIAGNWSPDNTWWVSFAAFIPASNKEKTFPYIAENLNEC